MTLCGLYPGYDRQDAIDQRVRAEECNEKRHGQPRHDRRDHPEEDCQRTPQRQGPPVSDEHNSEWHSRTPWLP